MDDVLVASAEGAQRVGFARGTVGGAPPLPPGVEVWCAPYAVAVLWPVPEGGDLAQADDEGVELLLAVLSKLEPPGVRLDGYLLLLTPAPNDLAAFRVESRTDVARRFVVASVRDLRRVTFFPLPG